MTYLDHILDAHRQRVEEDRRSVAELVDAAAGADELRGFAAALSSTGGLGVIAEVKRRSPSKGVLAPGLDPAVLAAAYARGGATCLSVLTDEQFFGGSAADLAAARGAVDLPVLRKDFTVAAVDVYDARIMGADAVLLIAAALGDDELQHLHGLACELGLDPLVEVHDEAEVERAVRAGATLVGVNQRDLVTFEVDQARAVRVAPAIPAGAVRVAESGITGPEDARVLRDAGYHAVLVGEHLVRSGDPAEAVRRLRAT